MPPKRKAATVKVVPSKSSQKDSQMSDPAPLAKEEEKVEASAPTTPATVVVAVKAKVAKRKKAEQAPPVNSEDPVGVVDVDVDVVVDASKSKPAKRQKKDGDVPPAASVPSSASEPVLEQLTLREAILIRNETYIGSKQPEEMSMWVVKLEGDEHAATADGDVEQEVKVSATEEAVAPVASDKVGDDVVMADSEAPEATAAGAPAKKKKADVPTVKAEVEFRKLTWIPAKLKLFDEVLVNAADNKQRDTKDVRMTRLDITLNQREGWIRVRNDGHGIRSGMHESIPFHVPELIFGHLLTSTNYNDKIKQTVGGRNGLGAKLTNTWSTRFEVIVEDATAKKRYTQIWRDNMSVCEPPVITTYRGSKNSTTVQYWPDLARFGMDPTKGFDDDTMAILQRRACDIAGTTPDSLKVYLNDKLVPIRHFKDYVSLYLGNDAKERPRAHMEFEDRPWEMCIALNETGKFSQMSFVNNIATTRGGDHVDAMNEIVCSAIIDIIKSRKSAPKDAKDLAPADIKKHLFMFLNTKVINPEFDNQCKTELKVKRANLETVILPDENGDASAATEDRVVRRKFVLPDSFLNKLRNSGIVDEIVERATAKFTAKQMKQGDGKKNVRRIVGIPKLEDANLAGTKDGHLCCLILTEVKLPAFQDEASDSAKALAVSGLSVVGRDHYGVYPLKGKMLNVREASATQIADNKEIQELKQILGLRGNDKYPDIKTLRYGRVMIMADQDHDGSHIKGLVVNLFDECWPGLIRQDDPIQNGQGDPSFLWEFITPIVKVTKGVSASGVVGLNSQEVCFYSLPQFNEWLNNNNQGKGWNIKYYKSEQLTGLGTSTAVEAKQYFSELDRHMIEFKWDATSAEKLKLAFDGSYADARKGWLARFDHNAAGINQSGFGQKIGYSDFVDKELILFSHASNERAIPSVIDGLKPGQRKIVFSAFKRNLKREVKVAQLAGYVSEHSAYHHGEASLCSTIVNLAQNFVGANNVNLFLPNGQFGTRLKGGKDAASARYIFTTLSPVTRAIYPMVDDAQLTFLQDDGQSVEPEFYVPVLPMVLVNGSSGIGTGWSSAVPNYNPRELTACLKIMIEIEEECQLLPELERDQFRRASCQQRLPVLHPYYKNFNGRIQQSQENPDKYFTKGIVELLPNGTSVRISELPVGMWTSDYKAELERMLGAGEIKEFREYHTDTKVSFVVDLTPEQMVAYTAVGLYRKFDLTRSITTSNMVLFDRNGKLKKYASPNEILADFFPVRLEYYQKRKEAILRDLRAHSAKLQNKVRFVRAFRNTDPALESIDIKCTKKQLVELLSDRGYLRIPKKKAKGNKANQDNEDDAADVDGADGEGEGEEVDETVQRASDYDYLLSLSVSSLTTDMVASLEVELDEIEQTVSTTDEKQITQFWKDDLEIFSTALDQRQEDERQMEIDAERKRREKEEKAAGKSGKKKKKAPTGRGKKRAAEMAELDVPLTEANMPATFVEDTTNDDVQPKLTKKRRLSGDDAKGKTKKGKTTKKGDAASAGDKEKKAPRKRKTPEDASTGAPSTTAAASSRKDTTPNAQAEHEIVLIESLVQ